MARLWAATDFLSFHPVAFHRGVIFDLFGVQGDGGVLSAAVTVGLHHHHHQVAVGELLHYKHLLTASTFDEAVGLFDGVVQHEPRVGRVTGLQSIHKLLFVGCMIASLSCME